MSITPTVSELYEVKHQMYEIMEERVSYNASIYLKSVRAIYGVNDKGDPVHVGSCFLLEIRNVKFLITAAHVIDESQSTGLYIGSECKEADTSGLVPIEGVFRSTNKPNNDRKLDLIDFSFLPLEDNSFVDKLGAVEFIKEEDLHLSSSHEPKDFYLALGYPNTRDQKVDRYRESVKSVLWHYWSTLKNVPKLLKKLSISGRGHYFLDFDFKKSLSSVGHIVNSTNPKGASGGVIVNIGRPNLKETTNTVGKLAGIIIEGYPEHGVIMCTKIDLIIWAIKKYYFEDK